MKKAVRVLAGVVVLCTVIFCTGVSFAQEVKNPAELEEVVVTATGKAEEVRKIPAHVTVITAKEIAEAGAVSIVDVLDGLAGINFRTFSANPSQAQLDLRGFGENGFGRTLVLLDGRKLNRPDMASVNWLQIPISNVERIEIVRGASSVLYGDCALAGVVNIITKAGSGKPKAEASIIAGSYGLHDERVSVSGSGERVTYALNGENQESSGYREQSDFSSRGAGFDVGYDVTDTLNVSAGVSFNHTDFEMPGCLTEEEMEEDRRQYQPGHSDDDSSNEYLNADLKIEYMPSDLGIFSANLAYGNKKIETNTPAWFSYNNLDIDTIGLTPRYELESSLLGHANKLTIGTDYYHETLDKEKYDSRGRDSMTFVADLTRNSIGWYIRDEFSLTENLILGAGYRMERVTIEGDETDLSTDEKAFDSKKVHAGEAYETSLTYLLGKQGKVFARYAKVFRIPFLDEQVSYYGYAGSDAFYNDIEKETGKSMEIGTRLYPLACLDVGLTLFRVDMEDEIAYNGVTWQNENMDETRHEGVELSFSCRPDRWISVSGNCTYQNTSFTEGADKDKEIPLVPETMANLKMDLSLPFDLVLSSTMQYVGTCYLGNDRDNSSDQMDDYTLFDAFLYYRPVPENCRISAFFGVENLTDEQYSTIGYEGSWGGSDTYYPSPGITVKGGISVRF
ncbi:MAG TPA: TonB-dependent receptor [Syntrophales bacterium]|nr:TonB-dependent receptor [Syntrophales bacterium]HPQ44317.1 TonB-dependent receptor [Syntrophales bacterium]